MEYTLDVAKRTITTAMTAMETGEKSVEQAIASAMAETLNHFRDLARYAYEQDYNVLEDYDDFADMARILTNQYREMKV